MSGASGFHARTRQQGHLQDGGGVNGGRECVWVGVGVLMCDRKRNGSRRIVLGKEGITVDREIALWKQYQ